MLDVTKDHEQRVLFLPPPKPGSDLLRACLALTHQAKNLYNTGIYLIRQVASAYDKHPETGVYLQKQKLHQTQLDAIVHFTAVLESVNEKRKQNFGRKRSRAEEKGEEATLKLLPVLTPSMTQSYFSVLLDETILDAAMRSWPGKDGSAPVYKLLPAAMAQQVGRRVLQAFRGSFAGLRGHQQYALNLSKPDHFLVGAVFFLICGWVCLIWSDVRTGRVAWVRRFAHYLLWGLGATRTIPISALREFP
jgi:hypothetical protein